MRVDDVAVISGNRWTPGTDNVTGVWIRSGGQEKEASLTRGVRVGIDFGDHEREPLSRAQGV
jgi:hypothetical protein